MYEYRVATFVPKVAGCAAQDMGWDAARCEQFEQFLNSFAQNRWKLHSQEFRNVVVAGCGNNKGVTLVCTFERTMEP